ncbi:hypothetical protein [Mycobacterium haemophilum]
MTRADDDAERSDEEEWRIGTAADDAERSDEEEWRIGTAADDDAGAAGIEEPRL